jgi:dTDP-4-dehydrorhamnose 3,5-epimerase
MRFNPTSLPGCYEVLCEPRSDERGWFARTYCKDEFNSIDFHGEWLQMNHSFTKRKGTVRGLHFQFPPFREIKLVRCISGAVMDVLVDIRKGSVTFMHHLSIELSAERKNGLFIPEGVAHGFQALTDDVEMIYLHSASYESGHEGGLRYDDPRLGIVWPLPVTMLSGRDAAHPAIDQYFTGI